ncbi:MAG: oligosaccharide flippase family protein, partial [Aliifodinibius sp.]|nr:oligosaccharide flippase family protein [Candidatus Saccharibacteria bacterium]NIS45078.1 oligosaccharide flippase family protein [candidate division Zixibacteria bacterium]NIT61222.1 oligosaccharide flippase family protein [Fodinibius sp.]NIU13189.1 oligosaccharide flippase family protein [candidate division Zixibacteria bacterium]NIV05235.1 oligosaccharide flippase family protein [candidate division Zixibacteria bacterium]
IIFALTGFGVWSLVWGRMASVIWTAVVYWLIERWQPTFTFDMKLARSMLGYGIHI